MTTADTSTASTVDQAGTAPAATEPPPGDAAPAAPVLVPVTPGLVVKFTRRSELRGDQELLGIVIAVEGERARIAELGQTWDVPANAVRSVNG